MDIREEDRAFVKHLREHRILHDVNDHRLNHRGGVIMVTCSDGDQIPDIFARHSGISLAQEVKPRIHTLALNGGALLIPESSPLVQARREDEILLHHIEVAQRIKLISVIALYAHLPCGAANLKRLGAREVIQLLIEAKERLKRELVDVKVGCFLHVDKGGGNKRTYFISRNDWINWRELH